MTTPTQNVLVHPAAYLGGTLQVPGDKSISHRVAMLAGLAAGASTIRHFLTSEDCLNTVRAMEAFGARTSFSDDQVLHIQGTGGKLLQPAGPLDLGNSGTSIRLLAGLLAGFPLRVEMTGDESLRSRPMRRIQTPLLQMGAQVELLGENGCAPVRVTGGALQAITYELPMASAQVKSCVLLAGLSATGRTTVVEPLPTRDHTERLLQALGLPVTVEGLRISVEGRGAQPLNVPARDWVVPGDFSSAAFPLVAVAARPGATVSIQQLGLNPRRTALLEVLRRMGAEVQVTLRTGPAETEPGGEVRLTGAALHGTEVGGAEIPNLIDELPIVAVLGALAQGTTVIRDAQELRVKESDRIATMAANLRSCGVTVEERPDGMVVHGGAPLQPTATVRSLGDHRIAMAMAVLATYAQAPVCIQNIACIETSYPGFWTDLRRLGAHVE